MCLFNILKDYQHKSRWNCHLHKVCYLQFLGHINGTQHLAGPLSAFQILFRNSGRMFVPFCSFPLIIMIDGTCVIYVFCECPFDVFPIVITSFSNFD